MFYIRYREDASIWRLTRSRIPHDFVLGCRDRICRATNDILFDGIGVGLEFFLDSHGFRDNIARDGTVY